MTNKKVIEFVCSGNHDRSPFAEMKGWNILIAKGIEYYVVISSGTSVNKYQTGNIPTKDALFYARQGLEMGLLADHEEKILEKLDESSDPDIVRDMFLIANDKMLALAKQQKAEAMWDLGYPPLGLKVYREQTVQRGDTYAVLCMTDKHCQAVEKLYVDRMPECGITRLDKNGDISDPYCKGVEYYKEIIQQVAKATEMSLKQFI